MTAPAQNPTQTPQKNPVEMMATQTFYLDEISEAQRKQLELLPEVMKQNEQIIALLTKLTDLASVQEDDGTIVTVENLDIPFRSIFNTVFKVIAASILISLAVWALFFLVSLGLAWVGFSLF